MQNILQLHDKTKPIKITKKQKMPSSPALHILQPKHTLLKADEAEKILDKFNISVAQLPKIKITDPALPKGANVGDVIKIERKDENLGHAVYYRVVIL